jgi:hypothetical protein
MFGRPLSLPPHHFNTKFPSPRVPDLDPTGRFLSGSIALFRLSFILGEILGDAVSLRPVSYDSTLAKDRLLIDWLNSLPEELSPNEDRILRNLTSPVTAARRLGIQVVALMSTFYHMRFTLHRPHVRRSSDTSGRSLDIAVSCAEKLMSLAEKTGPEVVDFNTGVDSRSAPRMYRHLNWRPLHVFSAAMFFTFQLIQTPTPPDASRYKSCINRSLRVLNSERSHNMDVAQKAINVLLTLAPLYSTGYLSLDTNGRQQEKAVILSTVKTIAFPYMSPPFHPTDLYVDITTSPRLHQNEGGASYGRVPLSRDVGDQPYSSPPPYMAVSSMRTHSDAGSHAPQFAPGPAHQWSPYEVSSSPGKNMVSGLSEGSIWGGAVGFAESEWLMFMQGLQPAGAL